MYLKKQGSPWLLNLCNTAPLWYRRKAVTIHDLAFLKHPEWFTWSFSAVYRFLLPKLARGAAVVFTVSKQVKKELMEVWQLPEQKVKVAYNGLAQSFTEGELSGKEYERPYFLAFGSSNPRKNTARVVEAMQLLQEKTHDLRIVGRAEHNFKQENIPVSGHVIEHSDVNDEELKQLYAGATALVYPSLYEGFGLPPLEALACGCPVILSNNEVFKELYEGFAIFVDPLNSASIKNGMLQAIQHPPKHSVVALRNKYSYLETARGIWEVMDLLNKQEHGA
jgi:glycosyltransferase involved in cell wall biosynthesis